MVCLLYCIEKKTGYFPAFFRVFFFGSAFSVGSADSAVTGSATPSAHNLAHSASDTEYMPGNA